VNEARFDTSGASAAVARIPEAVRLSAIVLLALALLAPADARAQPTPHETAPVVIDGTVLFRVRGVTAYPAAERAAGIEASIRRVAADRAIPLDAIKVVSDPTSSKVVAGDQVLFQVLDEDAAVEGVKRETLAQALERRTRSAIEVYRRDRDPTVLAEHAAYSAGATLVLVLFVALANWVWRRADALLERRFHRQVKSIEIQSRHLLQAEHVWAVARALLRALRAIAVLLALWAWATSVLPLFPWTRQHAGRVLALVVDPLETLATGFVAYLPSLAFLVVLALLTRYGLRLLHLLAQAVGRGAIRLRGFEPEWAWPTYRIAKIAVIGLAIVIGYPYVPGSGSEAFKGVSIFLGLVFSLGSSSVVSNMIAGYSLIYRRTFKVGDRVQIDDAVGEVVEMRLQVTHLRTPKNEEVIVPNSTILNSKVVNYSSFARQQGLVLHTAVGIGYEVPWRQVESMLLIAAERTDGLLREPKPFVLQKALGDFAVTYEINAYCADAHGIPARYTELHRNILDVFNEYGVQIMTPAYESDPAQPKVVPPDRAYAEPARR